MAKETVQIKFTIDAHIVSAFKARCETEGVSMASAARQWMSAGRSEKSVKVKLGTRPTRRKAVSEIIGLLNEILENEERYRDSIPEQFEQRQELSELSCNQLADAISCLEEAF
jgi:hypothetical protein